MSGWAELDRLLRTDPLDAGCDRARELLDVYAELLRDSAPAARIHYPDVAAHIRSCGPCAEDLDGLLAALDATD